MDPQEEKKEDTEVTEENGQASTEETKEAKTEAEDSKEGNKPQTSGQSESGSKAEAKEAKEDTGKPAQTKEQNAYQAEMRRLREENAKLKRSNQAYQDREKSAITDKALEDLGLERKDLEAPENLKLASSYMEGLSKGETNPALYAYKQQRIEAKKAKAQADAESAEKAKKEEAERKTIREDSERFAKEYPDVKLLEVLKPDSDFAKAMAKRGIDVSGHVTEYYGLYLDLQGASQPKATPEKAKAMGVPPTNGQIATNPGQTADEPPDIDDPDFDAKFAEWEIRHGMTPHKI